MRIQPKTNQRKLISMPFQVLTIDLINRVFNIDFITRLEKELSLMYDAVNTNSILIAL